MFEVLPSRRVRNHANGFKAAPTSQRTVDKQRRQKDENIQGKPGVPPQQAAAKPIPKMPQHSEGCVAGGPPARDEVAVRLRRGNRTIPLRSAGGHGLYSGERSGGEGRHFQVGVAVSGYGGP